MPFTNKNRNMNHLSQGYRVFWHEKWVPVVIELEGLENPPKYEVSNFGRVKSFQSNKDGVIIKGSIIQGYKSLNIRVLQGKSVCKYIHKLVADAFVEKPTEKHKFVIHLDFDKLNNHFENLKWVTQEEVIEHNRTNPANLNRKRHPHPKNQKLTEMKVRMIKKMLKSKNTRFKMIAKQFGITNTQLQRIRSGENWGYVVVED